MLAAALPEWIKAGSQCCYVSKTQGRSTHRVRVQKVDEGQQLAAALGVPPSRQPPHSGRLQGKSLFRARMPHAPRRQQIGEASRSPTEVTIFFDEKRKRVHLSSGVLGKFGQCEICLRASGVADLLPPGACVRLLRIDLAVPLLGR
ncbi:unnamed protein product [Prorocentrum cordatum]|uniref:Uncharacterized protein n=1 Tax=Prorocentrum cordatum TaxID=2364126 RepID=A0ABN9Y2M3_9DINO|nr:unnamed protein product [Polarella glacialis]